MPGVRILYVEDHADIGEMTVLLLGTLGHQVKWVRTASAARDCAGVAPFDLLIADYRLPDGNGLELFRQMHDAGIRRAIIITASSRSFVDQLNQDGVHCIEKPADLETLRKTIEKAMAEG